MRIIGNNPAADNAEITAVASGTLPSGQPVVVNADGTVSVVAAVSAGTGSLADAGFDGGGGLVTLVLPNTTKFVGLAQYDSGNNAYGTAIVGTVSGSSISFGTKAVVTTSTQYPEAIDGVGLSSTKFVVVYKDSSDSNKGKALVGTVSGTSISFGSVVIFEAGQTNLNSLHAVTRLTDTKFVISFEDASDSGKAKAIVGTVSGTSVSFGTAATFGTVNSSKYATVSALSETKVVIAWSSTPDTEAGKAVVGTVSGTSISFGSAVTYDSSRIVRHSIAALSDSKFVIAYNDDRLGNNYGTAIAGTVSGTSITLGTAVVWRSSAEGDSYPSVTKINSDSFAIAAKNDDARGAIFQGSVSGTSITFDPPVQFTDVGGGEFWTTLVNDDIVVGFPPSGNLSALTYSPPSTNLTAENFIGFAGGSVVQNILSQASGTPVQFEPDSAEYSATAYDSNSNRVVIAYSDTGDSNKGKAVVATVNAANNSVSFGTPVVFEAGYSRYIAATFDSNSNKIVIMCSDGGNSSYGTAIVGTVDSSNNSISFGSAVVFESAAVDEMNATFDSNANKVVIAYRDKGNSNRGTSIIGTVSGTSISFGTAVVFLAEDSRNNAISFDSTANKVVIAYGDNSSTYRGTAIVGTVSGTGISFGSQVVFANASTVHIGCTYDSNSNKTVIAYADAQEDGTAIVATVSGTSISFGTAVEFDGDASLQNKIVFDSNVNKVVNMYRDGGNSDRPTMIVGTVSGTSISFETAVTLSNSGSNYYASVFDTTSKKVVVAYQDSTNTAGFAAVFQASGVITTRAEVASGSKATIDIGSAISTNQLSLTAGQQYFVQTDGTIGLTAADPSVIAGTAISATEIIVKG